MPTTLSTDEMKARVRSHFEDFVNNRKAEVIRTNMTPDFYDHDGPGGEPTDTSGDEEMMRQMYTMMPDLHLTIEDLIAEDDKVVTRWSASGTHNGDFVGVPASGRLITVTGIHIHRVRHGRLVEHWEELNMLGVLRQLGVLS